MARATALGSALLMAAFLTGCAGAFRSPSIANIKNNPAHYNDRTVNVEGVVTSSWGLPLVPFKVYKVDDGTGELTVIARGGHTPTRGSHVRVRGKVEDVAVFGGQSVGLHMLEHDLDVKSK